MKVVFLTLKTSNAPWAQEAAQIYESKISHWLDFEFQVLKSKAHGRDQAQQKIEEEEKQILQFLKPTDHLWLFDETGKTFHSRQFCEQLVRTIESSPSRLVFLIGGAYGVSPAIKTRAQTKVSLSALTMNHLVAQVVALEQIYRALTIWKNLPYHND